jgi:DNA-binding SARP family transcriptional activator
MRLAAQLLGGFRVSVDGRELPAAAWRHRRAAELVKLLLLAPGNRLSTDRAIDALWPDLSPDGGAANLRKAAHHARRALGTTDSVVLGGGQVTLCPAGEVVTDASEFEHAAERALRDGDAEQCRAAAALFSGDLLPDDRYSAWAIDPTERLRARFAELLRRAGMWEQVIEADPLDEEAHRSLMEAYAEADNRAAALRQFRRLRDALGRAGLRPSPASVALYEEIASGPAAVAPVSPSAPIVGRDAELDRTRAAWHAAAAGRGGAVLVLGEAGAGKTRLCEELLIEAAASGATTIRAEAHAEHGSAPYSPVAEAIDRLLLQRPDFAGGLGDAAQEQLVRLTSAVPDPTPAADAQLERRRIFLAVGQVVAAAAREHGAVLLCDDVHAADDASLELMHHLARSARLQRLLVVMAYREEEAPPALTSIRSTLLAQRAATEVRLPPLPREAVVAVVERVTGRAPAPEVADEIFALTEGNPFFVEELARCMRPDGSIEVPAELYSVLQAGLARLAPELRRGLELAAVAGVAFDADEFVTLTGLPEADAFELLDGALAARVVDEWEAGYRFRHVLVRDALERSLPAHRRRAAHRDVAERLQDSGAPPARIAHHLVGAGMTGDAAPWLDRAARHAASVGALSDALAFAGDALAIAGRDERPRLLELRAELLYAMGRPDAADAYADALAVADPTSAPRLGVKQAKAHVAAGEFAAAGQVLDGLDAPTGEARTQVLLARALVAYHQMEPAAAREFAAKARDLAVTQGLGLAVGEASALLARAAHLQGTWPAHFRREFTAALKGPPEAAGQVFETHFCLAEFSLHGPASPDDVAGFARDLRSMADEKGIGRGQAITALMLGEAELLAGRLESAAACLDEAIALNRAVGASAGVSMALVRRGEVELAGNRRREAAAFLEPALRIGRVDPMGPHLVIRAYDGLARAAPDLASRLAVLEEAEVDLAEVEKCDPCSIGFLVTAAKAWALQGELDRARDYAENASRVASMWRGGAWPAAVREARAAVLRAEGEPDKADAVLREAAELFEQAQQPIDAARCRTLLVAQA